MTQNYIVLARKYRPTNFASLKGQDFLVRTIINSIKLDRVAHTFLLTGIRGGGKTTTARIIAKTINCENPIIEENLVLPCENCSNCLASNNHPDIIELDAASRTGVDDMRNIIENANYLPLLGKYKIFIIDEVHMLSTASFNALLKTLEEPPAHVKFIFATTELRKIPITILSRCQKFELRRLNQNELAKHLEEIAEKENIQADEDALHLIASHSEGSVRDSLSLFDLVIANANNTKITKNLVRELLGLHNNTSMIELLEAIISGNVSSAINILKESYYRGKDLLRIPQQLMELVHQISKIQLNIQENSFQYSEEETKHLSNLAAKLNISALTIIWQILLKGIQELNFASNQLISAEMLIIRLCHLSNIPTPADIIEQLKDQSKKNSNNIINSNKKLALNSFEDLVQLFHQNREMLLYHYLVHDVNLIEFEPLRVKIRQNKNVPQNLAIKIMESLQEWTGEKWLIIIASDEGNPTLSSQAEINKLEQIETISQNDIVQEVLQNFSTAKVIDSISKASN